MTKIMARLRFRSMLQDEQPNYFTSLHNFMSMSKT